MLLRSLFGIGLCAALTLIASSARADAPPKIVLDTDLGGDIDDVGALAVLNKLADGGECEILACVSSMPDKDEAAAAAIDSINTYYGRPNLAIGTYRGTAFGEGKNKSLYTTGLRDGFPHTAKPDDQQPSSLEVYRKTLAAAPDGSVKVVSIGLFVNLEDLLKSQGDANSPLNGVDLVKKKVKQLVVMGGRFPNSNGNPEWNFSANGFGSHTQYVTENWPTPILFSGFDIGEGINTGTKLGSAPANDPVRRAYELFNHFAGRQSWDLTAVLAAVRDPGLYWTVHQNGYCWVEPKEGNNVWTQMPNRGHSWLDLKTPPADIAALLESILAAPPNTPLPPPGQMPPAAKPN